MNTFILRKKLTNATIELSVKIRNFTICMNCHLAVVSSTIMVLLFITNSVILLEPNSVLEDIKKFSHLMYST